MTARRDDRERLEKILARIRSHSKPVRNGGRIRRGLGRLRRDRREAVRRMSTEPVRVLLRDGASVALVPPPMAEHPRVSVIWQNPGTGEVGITFGEPSPDPKAPLTPDGAFDLFLLTTEGWRP